MENSLPQPGSQMSDAEKLAQRQLIWQMRNLYGKDGARSVYTPHQGKREMKRRVKQKQLQDEREAAIDAAYRPL